MGFTRQLLPWRRPTSTAPPSQPCQVRATHTPQTRRSVHTHSVGVPDPPILYDIVYTLYQQVCPPVYRVSPSTPTHHEESPPPPRYSMASHHLPQRHYHHPLLSHVYTCILYIHELYFTFVQFVSRSTTAPGGYGGMGLGAISLGAPSPPPTR